MHAMVLTTDSSSSLNKLTTAVLIETTTTNELKLRPHPTYILVTTVKTRDNIKHRPKK